jgi:hypothetical protein
MLATISLLTCLVFAVTYPVYLAIGYRPSLGQGFHRFHVGLAGFLGAMTLMGLWLMAAPDSILLPVAVWVLALLMMSWMSWRRDSFGAGMIVLPGGFGVWIFFIVQRQLTGLGVLEAAVGVLAGLILTGAFFTMNLGHWYLNVSGLPIAHLKKAVRVFTLFLLGRFVWDVGALMAGQVEYTGDRISLFDFLLTTEGFLLWPALFFGTVFPLIAVIFVNGTLKVKSTQSATGILYVIVSSVLIGDIAYKYYLFRHGIAL